MTVHAVVIAVLLWSGVAVQALSSLGVLAMQNAYDRLHFLGPATTVGPVLLAAAVFVQYGSAATLIKVAMIVAILWTVNPVLTHATARAVRVREKGSLAIEPPEGRFPDGPIGEQRPLTGESDRESEA